MGIAHGKSSIFNDEEYIVCVMILDAIADYFLHLRDLKMDKQEIKREMKEQEGDQEIKHRRREAHMEILSEQIQSDIKGSQLIIANPTHLAVGIYHNPELTPVPFIAKRHYFDNSQLYFFAAYHGISCILNVL